MNEGLRGDDARVEYIEYTEACDHAVQRGSSYVFFVRDDAQLCPHRCIRGFLVTHIILVSQTLSAGSAAALRMTSEPKENSTKWRPI